MTDKLKNFRSLKREILYSIGFFGFILTIIVYSSLYFINIKNSIKYSQEKIQTEINVSSSYLKSSNNKENFLKIISTLISSDPFISNISYSYNKEFGNKKGMGSNSILFEKKYNLNNNEITIFYAKESTAEYLNALLIRMAVVASAFLILIWIISIRISRFLLPVSEIVNYFETFDVKKSTQLKFSKRTATEFQLIKKAIHKMVETLKNYSKELETIAITDSLTGLPNRTALKEAISKKITEEKQFALLFLDLDGFKLINDTMGHEAGDKILIHIGQRLLKYSSKFEIYRIGGDEFIILIDYDNTIELRYLSEQIINSVKEDILIETKTISITTSIGISLYPEHTEDQIELIKFADIAMYKAKEKWKNKAVLFERPMLKKIEEEFKLETELKSAAINEEFSLVFQPQKDLKTDKIIAVESLIRWEHPEKGHLSPAYFIDYLESSPYIIPVGNQIIKQSCQFIVDHKATLNILKKVSINIAAKQLEDLSFLRNLKRILEETECNPTWIEFEITERTIMENLDLIKNTLHNIRSMGITIAIDDFGTGQSSLSLLGEIPIDKLKIDKSFIDKLETQSFLTKSIIDIAKNMKIKVIAEGVETIEQEIFLKNYFCDEIQGYLFSKPLSLNILNNLLTK
jgi:diguanylate cyclase (GGDEF)-like protein